jgi:hypothetical protein
MPVTQAISSLGTPPSSTDPTNFDARADALLATAPGGIPNMVTELNVATAQLNSLEANVTTKEASAAASAAAAQALVSAVAFNASTAYSQYAAAISTVNLLTYRRKTAGTSATDPSADSANWVNTGLPPVVVVRIGVNTTALAGVNYIVTANGVILTLPITTAPSDLVRHRMGIGVTSYVLAPGAGDKIEGQLANATVTVDIQGFRGVMTHDATDGWLHI